MGTCVSKLNCSKPSIEGESPASSASATPRASLHEEAANELPTRRASQHSSTPPRSASPVRSAVVTNAVAATQVLREHREASTRKPIDGTVASFGAPIRKIPEEDFSTMVRDLRRDIQHWQHPRENLDGMPAEFRTRSADAARMLTHATEPDEHNLGYFVGTRLAGVMSLARKGDEMEISIVVTHPGSTGAGGALIESAVNLAEEEGCQGKVKLCPLGGATKAYEALGFEPTGEDDDLRVDPRASPDVWSRHDGSWRVSKHRDETYLIAMKQTAPLLDDAATSSS